MRFGIRWTHEPGKGDCIYLAEDNTAILFKLGLKCCGEILAGFIGDDGQSIDMFVVNALAFIVFWD